MPLAGPVRGDATRRRLQVLVRPEDVAVRTVRESLEHPLLGEGEVVETSFSGSIERLRLRMPALPRVRVIHPPAPFGDDHLAIDASRPQHVARSEPLRAGDKVWIGVRRLHGLLHPGLSFVAVDGEEAREYTGELARLAQARVDTVRDRDELVERLSREPADLVVARLSNETASERAEELLEASGEANLLLLRGSTPLPPQRFLIAVAVGEPGKEDVDFVGRLARHLGSPATVLTVLPLDADRSETSAADRFLAACVRTLGRWGVTATPESVRGNLAAVVERRMRDGHDLLVVGSPLADPEGRIRWGRHSRTLLEATGDHPVLVVRSGTHAA
jgi:hypothetical protein